MSYFNDGPSLLVLLILVLVVIFYDLFFGDGDLWK